MSSSPPTQPQPVAPAPAPAARRDSPVDLATLVITALASAAAAFICSKVWAPGTLASAAFTPVAVAVLKEALRKPTEVVTTVVPPVRVVTQRSRATVADPDAPTRPNLVPGADVPEPAIVAVQPPDVTQPAPSPRSLHWRVAVITGVLGFVVCAAAFTIPELIAGKGDTTFFGGSSHKSRHVDETVTTTKNVVVVPGKTVTTTVPTTPTTPAKTDTGTSTSTTPTTPSTGTTSAPETTPATPTSPPDDGAATTSGTTPTTPVDPVP